MVRFGQVVVGPPGSGKTTYCLGMRQYLKAIGRDAAVINLDPANHGEGLPYTPDVDIEELVSLEVRYDNCIAIDSSKEAGASRSSFLRRCPLLLSWLLLLLACPCKSCAAACCATTVHTLNNYFVLLICLTTVVVVLL